MLSEGETNRQQRQAIRAANTLLQLAIYAGADHYMKELGAQLLATAQDAVYFANAIGDPKQPVTWTGRRWLPADAMMTPADYMEFATMQRILKREQREQRQHDD